MKLEDSPGVDGRGCSRIGSRWFAAILEICMRDKVSAMVSASSLHASRAGVILQRLFLILALVSGASFNFICGKCEGSCFISGDCSCHINRGRFRRVYRTCLPRVASPRLAYFREITFKTDPEKGDYELETGASRNFESWTDKEATEKKHKEARYSKSICP